MPSSNDEIIVPSFWNQQYKNSNAFLRLQGVFWGLMLSLVVGIVRMGLDFYYAAPFCGSGKPDNRPEVISKVEFLHFATLLSLFATIVMVIISLCTKPRPREKVNLRNAFITNLSWKTAAKYKFKNMWLKLHLPPGMVVGLLSLHGGLFINFKMTDFFSIWLHSPCGKWEGWTL